MRVRQGNHLLVLGSKNQSCFTKLSMLHILIFMESILNKKLINKYVISNELNQSYI